VNRWHEKAAFTNMLEYEQTVATAAVSAKDVVAQRDIVNLTTRCARTARSTGMYRRQVDDSENGLFTDRREKTIPPAVKPRGMKSIS